MINLRMLKLLMTYLAIRMILWTTHLILALALLSATGLCFGKLYGLAAMVVGVGIVVHEGLHRLLLGSW